MQNYFIKQALGNRKKSKQKTDGSSDEELHLAVLSDEETKEVSDSKAKETIASVLEDFKEEQIRMAHEKKGAMIRKKIKTLGRMGKIYHTLKEENELLLVIK